MSIFDFIKNIASDAGGSLTDSVGNLADLPGVQEITDQVTNVTDAFSEAGSNIADTATSAIEENTPDLGA